MYTSCAKCSYNINKEIIEFKSNIKYKIISEINNPMFLFIIFEFLDDNPNIVKNSDEIELLEFNGRIKFNINNRNILKENIIG